MSVERLFEGVSTRGSDFSSWGLPSIPIHGTLTCALLFLCVSPLFFFFFGFLFFSPFFFFLFPFFFGTPVITNNDSISEGVVWNRCAT